MRPETYLQRQKTLNHKFLDGKLTKAQYDRKRKKLETRYLGKKK